MVELIGYSILIILAALVYKVYSYYDKKIQEKMKEKFWR